MSRRQITSTVAVLIACLLIAACGSKQKQAVQKPLSPAAMVTVFPAKQQGQITDQSQGLSFETTALNQTAFARGNLAQYLRTLGTGTIRIGGDSADESFWTSTNEQPPPWSGNTVTPQSLKSLADLANASQWRVVLTVNLRHLDAARAADEAKYASQILGSSLLGIAAGNEPETYYSNAAQYQSDLDSYIAAIHTAVPAMTIIGPDIQASSGILQSVLADEVASRNVEVWTRHYYPTHACSGNRTSINQLLSASSDNAYSKAVTTFAGQGKQLQIPAAVDETNSTACEGQRGVSDTFASALWALQSGLQAARAGLGSANFHSTVGACSSGPYAQSEHFYYTPLCSSGSRDLSAGDLAATPEYYGLLAQRLAGTGTFLDTSSAASSHVRAFALRNGPQMTLVLIDVDDPGALGATPVAVQLGSAFQHASTVVLQTSSSKGLSATQNISLGSNTVASDGTYKAPAWTPASVNGSSFGITVAPATATIIRFS